MKTLLFSCTIQFHKNFKELVFQFTGGITQVQKYYILDNIIRFFWNYPLNCGEQIPTDCSQIENKIHMQYFLAEICIELIWKQIFFGSGIEWFKKNFVVVVDKVYIVVNLLIVQIILFMFEKKKKFPTSLSSVYRWRMLFWPAHSVTNYVQITINIWDSITERNDLYLKTYFQWI